MSSALDAKQLIEHDVRGLLTRAERVKPLALTETMTVAAAFSVRAQEAIERFLSTGRHEVRDRIRDYLVWLRSPEGIASTPEQAHGKYVFLRLRFNVVLSQFDLFSEVMTQRSEHETGVFLAGLDAVARDALEVPGLPFEAPPVICYLQRGQGAAIRRARTRLPGGGENPVAIIKVPRERMVGSGVASSLVHEVGHQGAALLKLVESLRAELQRAGKADASRELEWQTWDRWCSEMLADLWSVARVGIAAPLGLMGVVALPRFFVFRRSLDEPHPIPWIRVLLSCAMGDALYPHPQWQRLAASWESLYPPAGLSEDFAALLGRLKAAIPDVVRTFVLHRPSSLTGRSVGASLGSRDRRPEHLARLFTAWEATPRLMRAAPPALVFAAVGQARADGRLSPETEGRVLAHLLTNWALRNAVGMPAASQAAAQDGARAIGVAVA